MSQEEYLSVADALERVLAAVPAPKVEKLPLLEAVGLILAADVQAADPLPPFTNSSMDGYAVVAADLQGAAAEAPVRLKVIADVAAGSVAREPVVPGTAARIMTGAPLPEGADAIVPVEDTDEPWRDADRPLPATIGIARSVAAGDYVRRAGSDVSAGAVVLRAGRPIRPQEISVLASLGISHVTVYRPPRVGILATGDELLGIDEPLTPGKIRNSNSYAIAAHVRTLGAVPVMLGVARDTEADVRARLQAGLDAGVDVFVSSAGVSVGAYDVVKAVLDEWGEVGFWRVRMRPGKPLAFGTYAGVLYFGLPGNPVSALLSFERFARPALLKLLGHTELNRPTVRAKLLEDVRSDGRETYVRAIVARGPDGMQARLAGGQGSHQISALANANALLIIPESKKVVAAGSWLDAMMIDWPNVVQWSEVV